MENAIVSRRFNWRTALFMLIFHIGAAVALYYFTWHGLLSALPLWFLANCPGVSVGFHRLLTHRGFKCSKWVEYLLTVCGCLALQGGAIGWVARHRTHHKTTDTDGDPHSPIHGFFHAYLGWILFQNPTIHGGAFERRIAPDLYKDAIHRALNSWWWLPTILLIAISMWWLGLVPTLWAVCVPVVAGWHAASLVNSVCHTWGTRAFASNDRSTNSWWVALLTFGDGYHHNHHIKQRSPRHGIVWYQFDPSWYLILLLRKDP